MNIHLLRTNQLHVLLNITNNTVAIFVAENTSHATYMYVANMFLVREYPQSKYQFQREYTFTARIFIVPSCSYLVLLLIKPER